MRVIRLDHELICFEVLTFVYFRGLCFDFGSERVIGFCTSSFSFYRYHMHCRESVWDEEFSYRIFRWDFMGNCFHVSLRNGYLGISFLIYAGSYFLDSGMSACWFLHSLQGVRKLIACCQSHSSSGRHAFMTWMLGALLLCHSFRCLIADSISRPYFDSRCFCSLFYFCFLLSCNLSFLPHFAAVFELISCQRKTVPSC